MDRIATVLRYQWRAYWRRFRAAGNIRASNVGLLLVVGGLGLFKYLQQLPLVASQLSRGETGRFETLLNLVFLAWMVLVLAESRRSISSRGLLHLPLSSTELFVIRVGSVFCSPVAWIVGAASLGLGYPIVMAQQPGLGLVALLMFSLIGLFSSLTIAHLLYGELGRRLWLVALLVVTVGSGLLWLGQRNEFAAALKWVLPHRLTVAAVGSSTPLSSLAVLVAFTALFVLLALWTFTFTLQPEQSRRSRRFVELSQFPGKFGGLLQKDLRYSSRLLDLYLALPVVIFFNMYLVSDTAPSAVVFGVIIGLLFLPCTSLVFNCFGLDSALGLDRYTLFPLSGKEKVFSKNLGFAVVMIALFATILPHVFWRLGPRATLLCSMEFVAVGLAYLSYGNWLSVKQPFKMQFYRFASGGSVVDAVMGMIFGSVPAAVAVYLLTNDSGGPAWKLVALMLLCAMLYLLSLAGCGRVLENEREEIRRALA